MCLGLPGRVVSAVAGAPLVDVDVAGVVRPINVGLLDGPWAPGDWMLIHSGFALQRMTPDEARDALAMLEGLGSGTIAGGGAP
jgi:hydrogenase expression/formation protein HypC